MRASPLNTTADYGVITSFNCSADGGPDNTVVWIKGSNISTTTSELESGNNFNHTKFLQQLMPTVSTTFLLSIFSVNATEDGGSYTCIIVNQAGFDTATVALYVRPLIVEHPKDQMASAGENVTLSCLAESFPYPEYQWQKYNTTSVLYNTLSGEKRNTLKFNQVQYSDYGFYRCVATAPVINVTVYSNNTTLTGKYNYLCKEC